MSIRHGPALTLLRQKGPSFKRGPLGQFDNGQRRFKCLTLNAQRYINQVFVAGTSDRDVLKRATGGAEELTGYPDMLVVDADYVQDEGDEATITVSLQGLMSKKADAATFTTNMEQQSVLFTGLVASGDIPNTVTAYGTINSPLPVVVHRWTTNRGKPAIIATGAAKNPPGISTADTARIAAYWDALTPTEYTVFEKWVLTTRTLRSPGDMLKSRVWAVEDTYQWTVIRQAVDA